MSNFTGRAGVGKWLVVPRPISKPRLRLFCVPNAGGDVTLFNGWAQRFSDIEVCGIQLPGRGGRFSEVAYRSMERLVADLIEALRPVSDVPCAIFGHSLGGLIAFELARRLQQRVDLRHVFISSIFHPPSAPPWRPTRGLDEAAFAARMSEFDGIPAEVWAEPELRAIILSRLRSDFEILDNYEYVSTPRLRCPLSVFGGRSDRVIMPAWLEGWREQASGPFSLELFAGDHFYLTNARTELLERLTHFLSSAPQKEPIHDGIL